MKKVIYILLLIAGILPAQAQITVFGGEVPVKIQRLRQVRDSVEVAVDFDFSNLSLGTDRTLILTPVLTNDKGREMKLKNIQVNGKQQHKAFLREVTLSGRQKMPEVHYAVMSVNSARREGLFHYEWPVEFEPWMSDARMYIISDLCACGGEAQQIATDRIAERIIMEDVKPYRVLPNVAYLRPAVEEIKARTESSDVFLDFPVSRTEINPSYGNNPRELSRIESIVKEIRSDANVMVTGVSIAGYASPEGEIGFNNELSRGRAEALRSYLASRSGIPPHLYRIGSGGEDWEGLSRIVQGMNNFGPKETVLSVIRYYGPAERKDRLKALDGGRLWEWMLNEIYPRLRRVVSRIEYTVRGFDVEEAKEVIKTRPQQLSLNEMFLVANTYEEGTKEFEAVFETAVSVFPNDPVANLNAAAAALLKSDLVKAENYLRKAQRNNPAYYNNLGVLSMMQNNLPRAKTLFQRAAEGNLDVALKNLEEVEKKEEADKLLTN